MKAILKVLFQTTKYNVCPSVCFSKKKKSLEPGCSQTFDAGRHGRNVCRDTSISILFLQSFSCNQLSVFFASVKPVPALICERN